MTALRMRARDFLTDDQLADVRQRVTWKGVAMIAHAWALIIGAIALVAWWPNPITYVLAVAIIGSRQLGLAILMHDGVRDVAAHGGVGPLTVAVAVEAQVQLDEARDLLDRVLVETQRLEPLAGQLCADGLVVVEGDAASRLEAAGHPACRCHAGGRRGAAPGPARGRPSRSRPRHRPMAPEGRWPARGRDEGVDATRAATGWS